MNVASTILPATPGTQTHSIPALPGEKLNLDIDLGDVHIHSGDENEVQFTITQNGRDIAQFLRHHQITLSRQGHEVSLRATGDSSASTAQVDIEYEITVPRKFDVQLKDPTGNAQLSGLTGAIAAKIDAGNIEANTCAGTLDLSTRAGNVTLHQITAVAHAAAEDGNVEAALCQSSITLQSRSGNIDTKDTADTNANTNAGNILSKNCTGQLNAKTKMGNVEVRQFTGSAINAQTTTGNVMAEIDAAPKSPCTIKTEMGNAAVKIIRTAAITLTIGNPLGNVDSDIPAGPVNGGGPEVQVQSRMGNISVHAK